MSWIRRAVRTGAAKRRQYLYYPHKRVPVALIEVGFMTNYKELDLLNSTSYQKKAAEGIYNAINEAFQEGY